MSDFRVHPVLTSPVVAAVAFAVVTMTVVDAGIGGLLQSAGGESMLNSETWGKIVSARWTAAAFSAAFAWFAWFMLFRIEDSWIKFPPAGVALGVVMPFVGGFLIWSLFQSTHMPEFQNAYPVISRISWVWASLIVLMAAGCIRIGLQSYHMLRGR